jgi:hypothetical protein
MRTGGSGPTNQNQENAKAFWDYKLTRNINPNRKNSAFNFAKLYTSRHFVPSSATGHRIPDTDHFFSLLITNC